MAARAGDRLLVLFPPNQANFILSMLRSGEFFFSIFSPPDQATHDLESFPLHPQILIFDIIIILILCPGLGVCEEHEGPGGILAGRLRRPLLNKGYQIFMDLCLYFNVLVKRGGGAQKMARFFFGFHCCSLIKEINTYKIKFLNSFFLIYQMVKLATLKLRKAMHKVRKPFKKNCQNSDPSILDFSKNRYTFSFSVTNSSSSSSLLQSSRFALGAAHMLRNT